MTIGIGMLCREGVLLCADTEITGWSKTHESKIITFECPFGKFGFVMAGNAVFARSAIQKCEAGLKATPPEKALDKLEKILEREYRRHVLQHPNHAVDPSLAYWLIVAAWSSEGSVQLFCANQTATIRLDGFHCIGAGSELADYLIRPIFVPGMTDAEALYIATYALARVKESIAYCGGMSIFINIRASDGNVATLTSIHDGPCRDIDEYARAFDYLTRRLLMQMAATEVEDRHFLVNLTENFNGEILKVRNRWKAGYEARVKTLAIANPALADDQVRRLAHKLATRGWID